MEIFKVTVAVDGRNLELVMKAGVMVTIETGSHEDEFEKPESKVSAIIGYGPQGLAAWIQVARFDEGKSVRITNEGWISEGEGRLQSLPSSGSSFASLTRVVSPSAEMLKCQEDATFGAFTCCKGYGNGCYVTCCNTCCADPARCPGASCCA